LVFFGGGGLCFGNAFLLICFFVLGQFGLGPIFGFFDGVRFLNLLFLGLLPLGLVYFLFLLMEIDYFMMELKFWFRLFIQFVN